MSVPYLLCDCLMIITPRCGCLPAVASDLTVSRSLGIL